jgi:hypothetical protein
MTVAYSAISQRGPGVGALGLVGEDFIACPKEQDFGIANFNLKATIFTKISQFSDSVQRHISVLIGFLL